MFLRKKAHNLFGKAEIPQFVPFKTLSERIAEMKTSEEGFKHPFSKQHDAEETKPKKTAKPKKLAVDATPEVSEQ